MNNEELEDDDYEYLCATVGCKNALDYCNEYCNECDNRNRNRKLEKPTRLCTTFGCEKEAEINDVCRACYQLNECQYESINDTQYYEKKRENIYEKIGNFANRKPATKKKSFLAANSENTKPKIEIPFRSFDGATKSTSIVTTNELKDDITYDTALIDLDYKLSDANLRDSTFLPSSTKQNLLCAYSGCGHDAIRDNAYCSNHTRPMEKMNNNSIQCIVQGCTNMRTGELLICDDCNKEQEGEKRLPYPIGLPTPSGDTISRTDRSQVPDISEKCQFCGGKNDVCANGFCTEYDQIQALTQQCPLCENYTVRSDGFCEDCYQNQIVANERLTTRNETNNALNPTMLCMTEGCDKTTRSIDELICTECSKEQEVALKEFKRLLEPPPLPPKLRSTSAPTLTLNSVLSSTDDNPNNSSTLSFEISATHRANVDAPELTVKSSLSVTNPFKNNTNTSNEEIRSKSEPGIFHSQNIKRKTEIAPNYFSSENESIEESKSSPLPFPRNFLQTPRSSLDIHRSVPLPSSNRPKPNLQDLFNLPEDTISSKNRSHSSPSLNLQALAKTLPPIPTQASTLSHMNRPLEVKCRGMSSSEHIDHSLITTVQTIGGSPATPVITDISSIKLEEVPINSRQGNYRLSDTTSGMTLRMSNLDGRTPSLYRSLSLKESQYPLNTSSQQTNERNKDFLVVNPKYRPVESGIPTSLPRQLSIPLIPTVPLSPIDVSKSAPLLPRAFDISSIGPPLPERNPIAQTLNLPGRPPPPIPPHPTIPLNPHEGSYSTRYISQRHPPPQHPPPPMIYFSNASNRNAPPPPSVTVMTLPPPRRQTSTLRSLSYPSFESLRQFGSMTSLNPPSLDMTTNQRNSLPESLTFHSLEEHPEETQSQDRNSPLQTRRVNEENNSTNTNTENPSSPSSLYYEVPEGTDFDEFIGDEGGYDVLSNQFNNDICKQPDCNFFGSQDFNGFCSSCHKKDIAKKSAEQLALSKETDDKVCIICVQNEYNTVVLPCGHLYFCYECAETLKRHGDCPICRRRIKSIHRVYKPN